MKIERLQTPPPAPQFQLTFSKSDGWAIVAALVEFAERHPVAVERGKWEQWAKDLDTELRR